MTESLTPTNRSTLVLFRMLLLCVILLVALAPRARADTTYTYTGNPFTGFSGIFPLSGTSNVSGSFTVAQPLTPNLFDAQVTPTTWDFTDGHFIWVPGAYLDANGDGKPNGLVGTGAFEVTTDSNGNITNWGISLDVSGPVTLVTGQFTVNFILVSNNGEDFSEESFVGAGVAGEADNAGMPGTWAMTTTGGTGGGGGGGTGVPEPSSVLLLASGLASLGFLRRRFLPA